MSLYPASPKALIRHFPAGRTPVWKQ